MHLRWLERFIAIVDAGSIRGAARRLGVSRPALTRALQQLEEALGVHLMRRSVRVASLTLSPGTLPPLVRVVHWGSHSIALDLMAANV